MIKGTSSKLLVSSIHTNRLQCYRFYFREGSECATSTAPTLPALTSFWSVATTLTDTVKQRTAAITASIKETDWRAELGGLQKELKSETAELGIHALAASEQLTNKARMAVAAIPTAVNKLPGAVQERLPDARAKLSREASASVGEAGQRLGQLGSSFIERSTDLFDHIVTSIEKELSKNDPPKPLSAPKLGLSSASMSGRYSRFDADVAAMQRDSSTYCEEPDDINDFENWKGSFSLTDHRAEIGSILSGNVFMAELQSRIVPLIVSYDDFWTRYYYRLAKLKVKHDTIRALTQDTDNNKGLEEDETDGGWGSDGDSGSTANAHEAGNDLQNEQHRQPEQGVIGAGEQEDISVRERVSRENEGVVEPEESVEPGIEEQLPTGEADIDIKDGMSPEKVNEESPEAGSRGASTSLTIESGDEEDWGVVEETKREKNPTQKEAEENSDIDSNWGDDDWA